MSLDGRLNSLAELKDDWDSYGGLRPGSMAIACCGGLTFTPTSQGGIKVELTDGLRLVEVEISRAGQITGASLEDIP